MRLLILLSLCPLLAPTATSACLDELMPYEQQTGLQLDSWNAQIESGSGGKLFYYGARHADDPSDPMFADIERAWNESKPTVAFYEGPDRGIRATPEETIAALGESGYVRFLASRDGVAIRGLEPSPVDEYRAMLEQFPADQVQIFYIAREAVRLRDRKGLEGEPLQAAIAQLIDRAKAMFAGEAGALSLETFSASYAQYFGTSEWWSAKAEWFDPVRTSAETGGVFTNEINRASSTFRNAHMARVLADAVNAGERAFAVVGRNHVPAQKAAIECLVRR